MNQAQSHMSVTPGHTVQIRHTAFIHSVTTGLWVCSTEQITQCMAITHTSFYVRAHSEQTLPFGNLHMLHKLNLWWLVDKSLRFNIHTLWATSHWSHCVDANVILGFMPKHFLPQWLQKVCKICPEFVSLACNFEQRTKKERQLESEVKIKLFFFLFLKRYLKYCTK